MRMKVPVAAAKVVDRVLRYFDTVELQLCKIRNRLSKRKRKSMSGAARRGRGRGEGEKGGLKVGKLLGKLCSSTEHPQRASFVCI